MKRAEIENNIFTINSETQIHEIIDSSPPLIFLDKNTFHKSKVYIIGKRIFDIICSIIFGIVCAIPIFIIAGIIFLDDPHASPFFIQERIGKNGKPFRMYKLRTMYKDAESYLNFLLSQNEMQIAFKIKDDPRITRIGKFLRKTSIDELPQLLNVFKGDMSFVGPRPALQMETEKYNTYQAQRLLVKPGLTCTWQIQPNRNDISFDDWMYLDLTYIRDRSFRTDINIIFRTFTAVCKGYGR